jgi:hypothetical protein
LRAAIGRGSTLKKSFLAFALILVVAIPVFSQLQALVEEVTGKVEIKAPGQEWSAAQEGIVISAGTTISTGFGSQAVLDLGASTLLVQQLTRMRLDELVEKEGTVSTELFLRVGKVRAEVKTTAGLKQDFMLRSPISTAAVRGTKFDYDGLTVDVFDNAVVFTNLLNQGRKVRAGEGTGTDGYGRPGTGERSRDRRVVVSPYTSPDGAGADTSKPATTAVTITLVW